jgi:hypothetical protein
VDVAPTPETRPSLTVTQGYPVDRGLPAGRAVDCSAGGVSGVRHTRVAMSNTLDAVNADVLDLWDDAFEPWRTGLSGCTAFALDGLDPDWTVPGALNGIERPVT